MQALVETIKAWQLHPVVDHFTVALIIVAILIDLVASVVPRMWLRHSALTILILGTAASWGSNLTGGWEAGRVWENVKEPALDVLKRHAWLGHWLPWVLLVLALWRLGIQFVAFIAGTRPIYLMIAVVAGGVMLYQGSLGGKLVYDYGVGTAMMPTASGSPVESASPQTEPSVTPAAPAALPTVFNPSASSTPAVTPSPEESPAGIAPSTEVSRSPAASPTPAAAPSPVTNPLAPGGTPVNPPGAEATPSASPGATPVPRNL